MKQWITALSLGLCVALVLLFAKCGLRFPPQIKQTSMQEIEVDLLEWHNKIRAEKRLPPLTFNDKLDAACHKHATFLSATDHLSHFGRNNTRPSDRAESEGYYYLAIAENIAFGQRNTEEVMRDWMNSPGHRRNILGDYRDVAFALAINKHGQAYWVVMFGVQR